MTNEEAALLLKNLFPPEGPDCVIDCAGFASTLNVSYIKLSTSCILNPWP